MKTKLVIAVFTALLMSFNACKTKSGVNNQSTGVTGDNSMNSVDWEGTYRGVLPCADCEGIETVITLNKDLSYQIQRKYKGKADTIFRSTGTFSWDKNGAIVELKGENPSEYKVGENKIFQLDQQGKRITGSLSDHYILAKQPQEITDRYWKLTEVAGKALEPVQYRKEPHIILKAEGNKITGNGGCNGFGGNFELKPNNGISITKMISTKMACENMPTEHELVKALEAADNYFIKADTLILNKTGMAPLAKFEAVYSE